MARRNVKTVFATSNYRGTRQGFTIPGTKKLSNGGRYIKRRQTYYNVRVGLGLSGG